MGVKQNQRISAINTALIDYYSCHAEQANESPIKLKDRDRDESFLFFPLVYSDAPQIQQKFTGAISQPGQGPNELNPTDLFEIFCAENGLNMDQLHSEIERLKRENECLHHQVVELQRVSSIGQLLSTTTHEFNNALMTIMNYAKMGLRNPDQAFREKSLTRILQASERAAKITHTILGMARNRSDQFELTSLGGLIRESMVLLEKEMQKYRVQVELELDEVPEVPVIGNQIQQILLNLCTNSRQAMPNGGRLVVRLKRDLEAGTVDLIVRDFGTGIAPEHLSRIFEPRFTTKAGPDATGKGGSGLGLAACRSIVQAHGGKIRVESTVGKGTSFTIKLPETRPTATREQCPPAMPTDSIYRVDAAHPSPLRKPIAPLQGPVPTDTPHVRQS